MENYAAPVENPWNLPVADAQDLHADAVKFAEKEEEEDADDEDDADAGDGDEKKEDEGDDAKGDADDGDGDKPVEEDEGKADVQMLVSMLLEICRYCRN